MIKNTNNKPNAADIITGRILEAMQNDKRVAWAKPWKSIRFQNAITKRPYSGVNVLLLHFFGTDSLYLTAKQLAEVNGIDTTQDGWTKKIGPFIVKGTKTCPIYFCKKVEKKDKASGKVVMGPNGKPETFFMARYFNVFPLNGVKAESVKRPALPLANFQPIDLAEKLIAAAGVATTYGGNRACYNPDKHDINLPQREAFHSVPKYYCTAFHEIAHAYLVELGGKHEGGFGSEPYSKEELAAELFANFCLSYCGIDSTEAFDNSVAYLQNWMERIGGNSQLIITASSQAQKRFNELLKRAGLAETESEEQAQGEDNKTELLEQAA